MIVRTRDAPLGSPTDAWIKPAPIEATPAATATHPSLREQLFGRTLAAFTARLPQVEFALGPPYHHQPAACGRAEMPTLLWVLAAGVAMSLLAYNLASASTVLVGALVAYALAAQVQVAVLLAFAAGNFLYIALADLVPELTTSPASP